MTMMMMMIIIIIITWVAFDTAACKVSLPPTQTATKCYFEQIVSRRRKSLSAVRKKFTVYCNRPRFLIARSRARAPGR